jgi:Helicase associated domain
MSQNTTNYTQNANDFLEHTEEIVSDGLDSLDPTPIEACPTQSRSPLSSAFAQDVWELKKLFPLPRNGSTAPSFPTFTSSHCLMNGGISVSCSSGSSVSEDSTVATFEDDFDAMFSTLPLFDGDIDHVVVEEIFEAPVNAVVPITASLNEALLKESSRKESNLKETSAKGPDLKRSRKYQSGQWNERYQELLMFRRQCGHLFVPHSYPPNQKLAQWVKRYVAFPVAVMEVTGSSISLTHHIWFALSSQRYQYKLKHSQHHSTLSNEREELLSSIGFIWDSHAASWQEQFQLLEMFFASHGHCNVPMRFNGSSALNVWCKHQRKQYKLFNKGASCTLTTKRVNCLDSIGFNWSPRKNHQDIA